MKVKVGVFIAFALLVLWACSQGRVQPAWDTLTLSEAPEPPWTQPEACKVKKIELLTRAGLRVDWSHSNNLLVFSKSNADGVFQVYTMKPDRTALTCLSCNPAPGGPSLDRHKGVYSWHPSGEYIFLQAVMERHSDSQDLALPGFGYHNNIWATTPDGRRWWQLTDYPVSEDRGALYPTVSHDGTKLAWAEMYDGPSAGRFLAYHLGLTSTGNPWGYWRINIADLTFENGGPRLENIRQFRPGGGNFFEVQDWSLDDTRVLFASDINRKNPHVGDLWEMDVHTQVLRAVTDMPNEWVEQARYSPDGQKIAFMSSECCSWDPDNWKSLVTELYLTDADGSHKVQLTHFNSPGYPESQEARSVATQPAWSADGTHLIVEQFVLNEQWDPNQGGQLWRLTFQGHCGNTEVSTRPLSHRLEIRQVLSYRESLIACRHLTVANGDARFPMSQIIPSLG